MATKIDKEDDIPPSELRSFLSALPLSVAIVTAFDGHERKAGVTVSSFTLVSLQPPIVAWCLKVTSYSRCIFEECSTFAFNFLSDKQEALCRHFAQGRNSDKFEGVPWQPGESGAPVFPNCAALMECEKIGQQCIGDHVMFFGQTKFFRRTVQNNLVALGPRLTSTIHFQRSTQRQRDACDS
jgi:flavin reductase (DIM6/NTAB) family NADH-FMN oxidoreductase RutF